MEDINMGESMDKEEEAKLKAMAAELVKDVKSEKDLGKLTRHLSNGRSSLNT
ncbi:MAG TPA: hypothetical protein VFA95_09795 [Gammaproteobacteria bacterium]|nr:hypothetical protein [Gammaproteobacteria bacterium]